ncbi:hypothetical protein, partial [Ornithinibacillus scapharcae]|uniref:hypothetical protein n=1 Tax=Ornithinibacillus scapharcae TaxID=1147159 RepID=UPI000225BC1F
NPELRAFNRFKDDKTLFNMTSKIAEGRLKESLDIVTDKMDMSNFSKEDYVDHWTIKYQNILSERYDELRTKIRYP